jgi:hypothetical protein
MSESESLSAPAKFAQAAEIIVDSRTKGTKGSESHDFKLRVLRAFVVETLFRDLPTRDPEEPKFRTF